MKTKLTFLLLFLTTLSFAQTIRRVNNNGVTGTNIYATIQAAHDDAVDGDIIYVEGTKTNYDGFTCTKQLTFVGAGYFLVENAPMQADANESYISSGATINFNTGSSGSQIYGFHIAGTLKINSSNITVSRNSMTVINLGSSISSILISQNILILITAGTTISNLSILNNFIQGYVTLGTTVTGVLSQNILIPYALSSSPGITGFTTDVYNFSITNNILNGFPSNTNGINSNNNTFSNNIGHNGDFPIGNGNQRNVDMTTVLALSGNAESRYKLKTGSPAIGAGVGGVDCGVFGGANPYILSGIPPYPTITSAITSTVGNSTTPINVVISTKSN